MIVDVTPAGSLDWDSPGKRLYHVPFTQDGAWARVRIPVCVIAGARPGPTLALFGGTHGDEYEGPVALKRLIHDLDAGAVGAGRLIIVPVLNVPAFAADRRESPLDGGNMNRVFPGDPKGSITRRIAYFVTTEVLSRADIVVDMHAGGRSLEMAPNNSFFHTDDPDRFQRHQEIALLFGMPFTIVLRHEMGSGLLTEEADRMGKIVIGGEFGSGASTSLDGVRYAYEGVRNVMRFCGMTDGDIVPLLTPDRDRQRVVDNPPIDGWLTAPIGGVVEHAVPVGSRVRRGQLVARIHDFERIDEPGCDMYADRDGFLLARRFRSHTSQGDIVLVIVSEREEESA